MFRVLLSGGLLAASATAEAAAAEPAPQVQEIVVTGEKRARSLQDTVASTAVLSAQRLDAANLRSLADVVNHVANVAETRGGEGFTIRGVSNSNVSGGGSGGLASVFVDGAAIP